MTRSLIAHVFCVVALIGCNDLTSVDASDVINPDDYATAAGANALAAGAMSQFHILFGGAGNNQVVTVALFTDELLLTTSQVGEVVYDRRDPIEPISIADLYNRLHSTRQQLIQAIAAFHRAAPDSGARIGQLYAFLGYISTFLAESYCAGVPLSHRDSDLRPVYGQPLTTMQLFDSAVTVFDSALLYARDSARIADLARLGKGRALLSLARFSEAAAAVSSVPTTYVYNVNYLNQNNFENGLAFTTSAGSPRLNFTVPNSEGINGIDWRTAAGTGPDPRTPLTNRNQVVGGVELWGYTAYQAPDAPIRLAGGVEARLIEAEAALQAGDLTSWLAIHNALRGTVPGLAPVTDPGTQAGRVDLHFRERAFWLFLTGHRHGDLRRLVRQYGRAPDTVFPIGVWRDGLSYLEATNIAPPSQQFGNPYYTGCLNRDA